MPTKHELLKEAAICAAERLAADTSVEHEEVLASLGELSLHVQAIIHGAMSDPMEPRFA